MARVCSSFADDGEILPVIARRVCPSTAWTRRSTIDCPIPARAPFSKATWAQLPSLCHLLSRAPLHWVSYINCHFFTFQRKFQTMFRSKKTFSGPVVMGDESLMVSNILPCWWCTVDEKIASTACAPSQPFVIFILALLSCS